MRIRAVLALAVTAMFSVFSVVPAAHADSLLLASDPQPHAQLSARPGWVTLVFKRDVAVSLAKILVLDSKGQNVTVGPLIVEGTNVTTQLSSDLAKDTYTVLYRIDRPDGQPEGGAFQFAYGTGHWTSVPASRWSGQTAEPPVLQNPNPKATTAAPTPSEEPSQSPSASASSTQPETTAPASAAPSTPAAENSSASSGLLPWVVLVLVAAVVAGGVVWWLRRPRHG